MKCACCILLICSSRLYAFLCTLGSCKCQLLATTKGVNKALFLANARIVPSYTYPTVQGRNNA